MIKPVFETKAGFFRLKDMKVLNPANTTHQIQVIPRTYNSSVLTLEFKNESTKELSSVTFTPTITNGYMYINFTKTFVNNDSYQFSVRLLNEVIYRGKIFVTNQFDATQNYKLTQNLFRI